MSSQQEKELLAWAAAKIQKAQGDGIFGTVTFFLENGVITRSKTETQDKPGNGRPDVNLTGRENSR